MTSHPVYYGNYHPPRSDCCYQTQKMGRGLKDRWVLEDEPWNQTVCSGWVALSLPLSCFTVCLLAPMMHSTVTVLSPQRRLCVSSEDPVTQCLDSTVKSRPKGNGFIFTFLLWFGSGVWDVGFHVCWRESVKGTVHLKLQQLSRLFTLVQIFHSPRSMFVVYITVCSQSFQEHRFQTSHVAVNYTSWL